MMVKFFNGYYFLYIFICAGFLLSCYFGFRNKSQNTQKWLVFGLLAFNFCLHFLKLCFEPYRSGLPISVRKVSFENICAVSTILFPFFFLSKKNTLRDYMYILGVMSGFMAMLIPTEALNKPPFSFDTIRFYFCHMIIVIAPLLMVVFGIHKVDYRRVFKLPFVFYGILCLILVNEIILMGAGFVEGGIEQLFDRNYRNSSFIFGPMEEFDGAAHLLTVFTPKIFLSYPFGDKVGQEFYFPILWLVVPAFIYITIIGTLLCLPYEHRRMKNDFIKLKEYIKSRLKRKI